MVISRLSVLVNIKSFFFDARRNTQTVQLVKALEDDESHHDSPSGYYQSGEGLSTEETETASVEGAAVYSK